MARSSYEPPVYLEIGKKRTFAGAIDWPGWCRSGRDEESAIQALLDYGPRYARVLRGTTLQFQPPGDVSAFKIAERLKGNATTDFGAPDMSPSTDTLPIDAAELQRFQILLKACWRAFDTAARKAAGKKLRKGPRGGGRDLQKMISHVLEAEGSYLSALGWKLDSGRTGAAKKELGNRRQAVLDGVAAAARGEIPARGPRGGLRWTPRYFVRRATWHILDHAWEIEDRII